MFMRHSLCLMALIIANLWSLQGAESKTNAASRVISKNAPVAKTTNVVGASAILSMDLLDDEAVLGIGDIVSYRVIEDKEDAKQLRIAESGELDIPYLGRFAAARKTCKVLAEELKKALEKELYIKATVIVALDLQDKAREKESIGKVYVIGQVRAAGAQDIPGDQEFTVSKAILAAGGFGDFANRKRVKLSRKREGEKDATFTIDVTEVWEKGKTERDFPVEPGDTIFVPKRLINF
jgi:polysaccharide biosynthesis/export protein